MPPRKKIRVSSTAEPSTPSAATPGDINQAQDKAQDDNTTKPIEIEPELWTDEEEISLFKGMIRWKPVGMHKRFRMISLSRHMRHYGHVSEHTRPQGIREKLNVLYNMKVLDERENASVDDIEGEERRCEFTLPASEFYDLMMSKRVDTDGGSSPGWLDEPGGEDLESSMEDSDEPQSSRASSVRGRGGRRGRGTRKARGGRGRGQKDSALRDAAKIESETSGEDQDEEDENESEGSNQGQPDQEDEDEGDNEDDEDNEDRTAAQSSASVSRSTRGRGRGRVSRGRGRGRRRG